MPLWKQRLFSRLQKPADDGADLGGAMASDDSQTAQGDQAQSDEAQSATPTADSEPAQPEGRTETDRPVEKVSAFLDALTDDPNAKPVEKAEATPAAAEDKEQSAAKPASTPEQEEAELLEGVKSDRGRDRIKQVFAERKALEQDLSEFKGLVQSSGMDAQQFAQTLEFGRLINSGDEANLRTALQMVEGQRAMLYGKLGIEAPGVDLLKGHDDLARAVENMEITRERAVELAKHRHTEAERTSREQATRQSQKDHQQFEQTVAQATGSMESYLKTREQEVDHPARMKALGEHFKNPANLQAFVSTYKPDQWQATIKIMYDGIQVPRQMPAARVQPIRTRPAALGAPAASATSPIDRVASRLDAMGI